MDEMGHEESMTRQADFDKLLEHFSRNSYTGKGDVTGMLALKTCLELFGKDYTYTVINNSNGHLCGHYPSQIVVLEYEGTSNSTLDNKYEPMNNRRKLEELMWQSRVARCRTRFVAPVILYKGKHVCRSGTLAAWQELFGRKGMDMFTSGGTTNGRMPTEEIQSSNVQPGGRSQTFDYHRGQDIKLLKELNVEYICDLMVEMKKVKCGMYITSSEKVDKENRYQDFNIIVLPYPGCEFFSEWKDSRYNSENVYYDWAQDLNTAPLDLQNDPILTSLPWDWKTYKEWDLVRLTQNYLLSLIHILEKGSSGVLIHCVSGWDRTPLFVSLLRLSLWADGVIHKSLPPADILYLTVAYDWFLFGHSLAHRVSKGQEIMYFCFKMLQYIGGDEFSVNPSSEISAQQDKHRDSSAHHGADNRAHQASTVLSADKRQTPPSSSKGTEGLTHRGSSVSLTSNNSYGSDGVPFVMDTTQDEDTFPSLGLDGTTPSPQRSRHSSENSTDGHRCPYSSSVSRGGRNVDPSPSHRDSSPLQRGSHTSHMSPLMRWTHFSNHSEEVSPLLENLKCLAADMSCSREPVMGAREEDADAADQLLSAVLNTNHFVSSPVNMPQRRPSQSDRANTCTPVPSLGSWVDVCMPQMTPPHMVTLPGHQRHFNTQCSVHSCCEASDINNMSTRARRLHAVSVMFEKAYGKTVLSRPVSSSGTLSSIIGNVAEKMGFRSGPR